jgi:glycosyltransferase involved in cell wall biosynthesis
MDNLKISIIMPSFNQAAYIDEAITSILSQDYQHKELIIIDGGSTDGSVEIIQKYSPYLAYWVSEPDAGQSSAINKGFEKATGQLLTWSNSDDILLPGVLSMVSMKAESISDSRQRWITGGCFWLNPEGLILRCSHARAWNENITKHGLVPVYSPSSFFSKDIIDEVGALDENLHYAMDTELWLRFAKQGIKYTASDGYFWGLRLHPNAKVSGHLFDNDQEKKNNPVLEKRRLEAEKINKNYGVSSTSIKAATLLHKLLSVTSLDFWKDKLRTSQFQNKPWHQCISAISQSR